MKQPTNLNAKYSPGKREENIRFWDEEKWECKLSALYDQHANICQGLSI